LLNWQGRSAGSHCIKDYQTCSQIFRLIRWSPFFFSSLARYLIELADRAYTFRAWDLIDTIGQIMLTLPASKGGKAATKYYRALGLSRGGNGDIKKSTHLLETAACYANPRYRARALTALGSNRFASRDYESALLLYQEADTILRLERTAEITVSYITRKMRAVVKSLNGDHRGALCTLEQLFPFVKVLRTKPPFAYYDYLNSLAVELVFAGRFIEARRACEIAIASPYARANREWTETRDEIARRTRSPSRSKVSVNPSQPRNSNLVKLPVVNNKSKPTQQMSEQKFNDGRVLRFPGRIAGSENQRLRSGLLSVDN